MIRTDGYDYSVSKGSSGGVSVGDGDYSMEVTTPSGKSFAREGYDSPEGAASGAEQTIENMTAPGIGAIEMTQADILEQLRKTQEEMKRMQERIDEVERRAERAEKKAQKAKKKAEKAKGQASDSDFEAQLARLKKTSSAGILNDDGRSA